MPKNPKLIYFPIDTGDQAQRNDPRSLLAQDVYAHVAKYLQTACQRAQTLLDQDIGQCAAFDRHRSHEAILLDGGRGTGKSSVLVNLPLYLDSAPKLRDELLILKPVDPTLLENGDDLFLNVIVAALMRDPLVRKALHSNEIGTQQFYDQLQGLGSALEGIQKIGKEYGLDKLRAFVENQELAEHVHRLFHSALVLTKKKLIVLPIDDVDTSLELAFENVEVVRKYLTSPYVLPVITGDLRLYDDVIYRQFAHRLLGMGRIDRPGALVRARSLAEEYERKVLPLPRRIRLPSLNTYLNNPNIYLADSDKKIIALPLFKNWIDALFNDRVNGEENSFRYIPLSTVREFAQFIQSTRDLLPALKRFFNRNYIEVDGSEPATMIRRKLLMSAVTATAVKDFSIEFEAAYSIRRDQTRTQRTARERAYRALKDKVAMISTKPDSEAEELRALWNCAVANYALHQRNWGSTYLIADGNVHMLKAAADVLGHDLFRPQQHDAAQYSHFEEAVEFAAVWQELLNKRAPEQWLARLPKSTLLSYPGPEIGCLINRSEPKPNNSAEFSLKLSWKIFVHWSYYSPTERSDLLLCGRMFELIVTSLTCDLTRADVQRILNRPPFYSLAAFAQTKTLHIDETIDEEEELRASKRQSDQADAEDDFAFETSLAGLIDEINTWRARSQISRPSAWFIFVVMNKFFSQTKYINAGNAEAPAGLVNLTVQSFNLFWSAVGSFEKGEVFGLPQVVATVNMPGYAKSFEHHPLYNQNIAPFLQLREDEGFFDFGTGAYTYALESHPLRRLWTAMDPHILHNDETTQRPVEENLQQPDNSIEFIDRQIDRYVNECRSRLNLSLSAVGIQAASTQDLAQLVASVEQRCSNAPETLARFREIIELKVQNLPKNSGRRRLQRIVQRLK